MEKLRCNICGKEKEIKFFAPQERTTENCLIKCWGCAFKKNQQLSIDGFIKPIYG